MSCDDMDLIELSAPSKGYFFRSKRFCIIFAIMWNFGYPSWPLELKMHFGHTKWLLAAI
jgi:hypothetical protein